MMLGHQLEHLGRPLAAMLDGFDAGERGAPHPFRGVRVDRHRDACALRRLDRELHLFDGEGGTGSRLRAPAVVPV